MLNDTVNDLKESIRHYYLGLDFNCSEALLLALNDRYDLKIPAESVKLLSGCGLGMGCMKTCGVLPSGLAALGAMVVKQRAHNTDNFSAVCAGLVNAVTRKMGSDQCTVLRETYRRDDVRCLQTIELAAEAFEEYIANIQD